MDLIVQKATELGVARIVPVLSQRSVVRLDAKQGEAKMAHWRAIAVGACEQCGRNRVPRIEAPRPLIHFLGDAPMNPVRLVLEPDLEPNGAMQRIADAVEIAIGPEGGFSADELEGFRISGYLRVRLGPRTLRAETAAIAALAWLQARFGDMQPGNFEPGRLSEYCA
jgi:16S rRNA (uracil1498-N3)-methyltransferase